MSTAQEIEIQRYHDELVKDVSKLVEKYRRIMDWDIPENDEAYADKLIFQAIQDALNELKQQAA